MLNSSEAMRILDNLCSNSVSVVSVEKRTLEALRDYVRRLHAAYNDMTDDYCETATAVMQMENEIANECLKKGSEGKMTDPATFYVNDASCCVSRWDIQIIFSRIVMSSNDGEAIIPQALIICSPQHAKALAEALTESVMLYEKKHGKLNYSKKTSPNQEKEKATNRDLLPSDESEEKDGD